MGKKQYNEEMGLFSVVAIVSVVCGHCGSKILTVGDILPYYAWHVAAWFFISGYFFRDERTIREFVSKLGNMLIKYYVYNTLYQILYTLLYTKEWNSYSLKVLFYNPMFVTPSKLAGPLWFVPCLFFMEILYYFICKGTYKISNKKIRYIIKEGMIVGGIIIGIYARMTIGETSTSQWWWIKPLIYVGFMECGYLVKNFFENSFTEKYRPCILVLAGTVLLLESVFRGNIEWNWFEGCAMVGVCDGSMYVHMYVTGLAGILFWKIITAYLSRSGAMKNKFFRNIGQNTFDIMANHYFFFTVLNIFIYLIKMRSNLFKGFNVETFISGPGYLYLNEYNIVMATLYVVFGLGGSLVIIYLKNLCKRKISIFEKI